MANIQRYQVLEISWRAHYFIITCTILPKSYHSVPIFIFLESIIYNSLLIIKLVLLRILSIFLRLICQLRFNGKKLSYILSYFSFN
jgi:hypothetical protein